MIVNIAELSAGAGKAVPFAFRVSADDMDAVFDDCSFEGLIAVEGRVVDTGTCYRAEGVIECKRRFNCDRCLDPCVEEQGIRFSEEFHRGSDEGTADEDANVFDGDALDITALVRDTLLAAQPLSNICKPECKGLCPVCGTNLNYGDCGCDRFLPDPRLAALQQLKLGDEQL